MNDLWQMDLKAEVLNPPICKTQIPPSPFLTVMKLRY